MRQINRGLEVIYSHFCNKWETNIDIYEHMPILHKYSLECEHITEFGMRWIVSTWGLLSGKPNKMISYDIVHPDICKLSNVPYNVNYHDLGSLKRIAAQNGIDFTFIQGNTLQITIEETDLLFIDTFHTYAQLKQELERHANKVRKYIILHDTTTYAHIGEDGKNEVKTSRISSRRKFSYHRVLLDRRGSPPIWVNRLINQPIIQSVQQIESKGIWDAALEFMVFNPWKVGEIYPNNNGLTVLVRKS